MSALKFQIAIATCIVAQAVLAGCGSDATSTEAQGGGGAPVTAEPGTERGPCYPNSTCNKGLSCASNLCVRLAGSGGGPTGSGGGGPAAGGTGAAGLTSTGGSLGAGSGMGAGGSTSTGGALGAGGRTGAGGFTSTGGAFGAGGRTGAGGATEPLAWQCNQVGVACSCEKASGAASDKCTSPKPTCCFLLDDHDCACEPYDAQNCEAILSQAPTYTRETTCPP